MVVWLSIICSAIPLLLITVKNDFNAAGINNKMKALLSIASSVQRGGKNASPAQIDAAKKLGAAERRASRYCINCCCFLYV